MTEIEEALRVTKYILHLSKVVTDNNPLMGRDWVSMVKVHPFTLTSDLYTNKQTNKERQKGK